jgi:hypothetical protein
MLQCHGRWQLESKIWIGWMPVHDSRLVCRNLVQTLILMALCDHSGDTIALASVSGPIEAKPGIELPSKAALEVILRPLSGIPG